MSTSQYDEFGNKIHVGATGLEFNEATGKWVVTYEIDPSDSAEEIQDALTDFVIGVGQEIEDDKYEKFWESHPFLKHINEFAYASCANPWAVMGMTATRALAALDVRVYLPGLGGSPACPNFFVGALGLSGGGKGNAWAASTNLCKFTNEAPIFPPGTGEGIAQHYLHRVQNNPPPGFHLERDYSVPSGLCYVDEITMLGALQGRVGSTMGSVLRSGWSGGTLGNKNATESLDRIVEGGSYRLCMVIGIQPSQAGILLDDAGAGGPQRILFMPADRPDYDRIPTQDELDWAQSIRDQGRVRNIPSPDDGVLKYSVLIAPSVQDEMLKMRYLEDLPDSLDSHSALLRLKLALGLALMCDGVLEVSEFWWKQSGVVMDMHRKTRALAQKGADDERIRKGQQRGLESGSQQAQSQETQFETLINSTKAAVVSKMLDKGTRRAGYLSMRSAELGRQLSFLHRKAIGGTAGDGTSRYSIALEEMLLERRIDQKHYDDSNPDYPKWISREQFQEKYAHVSVEAYRPQLYVVLKEKLDDPKASCDK